jgi:hypothetical protein
MNFKFSRGYGGYQGIQSIGMCCYGNTYSTELVLEQQ